MLVPHETIEKMCQFGMASINHTKIYLLEIKLTFV